MVSRIIHKGQKDISQQTQKQNEINEMCILVIRLRPREKEIFQREGSDT